MTSKKELFVKAEELAKKWMVGIKIDQDTIKVTYYQLNLVSDLRLQRYITTI